MPGGQVGFCHAARREAVIHLTAWKFCGQSCFAALSRSEKIKERLPGFFAAGKGGKRRRERLRQNRIGKHDVLRNEKRFDRLVKRGRVSEAGKAKEHIGRGFFIVKEEIVIAGLFSGDQLEGLGIVQIELAACGAAAL